MVHATEAAPVVRSTLQLTERERVTVAELYVDAFRRKLRIPLSADPVKSVAAHLKSAVVLEVVDTNARAAALYRRRGFSDIHTVRRAALRLAGFRSAELMVKELERTQSLEATTDAVHHDRPAPPPPGPAREPD